MAFDDPGGVLTPQEVILDLRCPSQTGCHLLKKHRKQFSFCSLCTTVHFKYYKVAFLATDKTLYYKLFANFHNSNTCV